MIKQLIKKNREITLYIVFGAVSASVNWLVYILLVGLMNVELTNVNSNDIIALRSFSGGFGGNLAKLMVCTAAAWLANVTVSFIANKLWVFESRSGEVGTAVREFAVFFNSRLLTGLIEWCAVPLLVVAGLNQSLFGVEGVFAKLTAGMAVTVLNFIFTKFLVFRKHHNEKNDRISAV